MAIMNAPKPHKVKMPTIEPFDGKTDPDDHLAAYKHLMYVQGVDDATWCRYFPTTLKGIAQRWFNGLPGHSINNFSELSMLFSHHFMANKKEKKTSMHLGNIVQAEGETLRSYVQRFNLEALQIPDLSDQTTFDNFFRGLRPGPFKFDVVRRECRTLQSMLREDDRYIHAQELCASTKKEGCET
ncbi:Activity-regulated cytoskeleton associated protein 2 [Bienertia sinuspersici]